MKNDMPTGDSIVRAQIEFIDSRIVIDQGGTMFPGDDHYSRGWKVSGAGLQGATCRTFTEAWDSFIDSLRTLSSVEPNYFGRFADLPTSNSRQP